MQVINLSKNAEELFFAKRDIENYLIENELIKEKMDLPKFVEWLNMSEMVYSGKDSIVPMAIIKTDTETYLFIVSKNDNLSEYIDALEDIDYNKDNLIPIASYDLFFNDKLNGPCFILNGVPHLSKNSYKPSQELDQQKLFEIMQKEANLNIEDVTQNMIQRLNNIQSGVELAS